MDEALAESSRNARQDAIGRIIRDAVRISPMVMLSGEPYVYVPEDGIYCRFGWNDMGDALYDAMRELGVKDGDFGKIDTLVRLIMRAISSKEAPLDNSVVVMTNGVFDTSDHQLKPYNERFIASSKVDYGYEPQMVPERWMIFLNQMLPNKEHQKLLQEVLAMAYIDRTKVKLEYLTILKGTGANGKSVVFSTVLKLLGQDNVSTFSISDLINSKREQNVAACNGKRMNYCSEIRTSEISLNNADAFKALVSGEPVMARALYHEPFKACNIPILLANANMLPRITDPSLSIQRRIIIIPFDVHVCADDQDRELARYIEDEISGVFNWVMEGLWRLQNNGYRLSVPQDIENLVREYVNEFSSVGRWLLESRFFARWNANCSAQATDMQVTPFYKMYCSWCGRNLEKAVSRNQFIQELTEKGFPKKRKAEGYCIPVFMALNEEEVRTQLIYEAIERQREEGVTDIDVKMFQDGKVRVRGVSDAEKYLGLPPDSLLFYYRSGKLDMTYEVFDNSPVFDIRKLQDTLALIGFYREINAKGTRIDREAMNARISITKQFNKDMELRGLPLFKYSGSADTIPIKYKDKILVPHDWIYTPEGAEAIIREYYKTNTIVNG